MRDVILMVDIPKTDINNPNAKEFGDMVEYAM